MHLLKGEYKIVDEPMFDRLMQCKISLNERLDKLQELDKQILALTEDEDLESKIKQADQFTDRIWQVVFRIEHKIQ